jgi:hypothetical protein
MITDLFSTFKVGIFVHARTLTRVCRPSLRVAMLLALLRRRAQQRVRVEPQVALLVALLLRRRL